MIGSSLLATTSLASWSIPTEVSTTQDNFVFNWYSLNNWTTKRVRVSNHDDIWEIELNLFNAPRTDWGWVLWHYYRRKDITISLSLSQTTAILLNDLIDDFKENTRETEWYLEITINSEVRRLKASISSLVFNRQYFNITFVQNVEIVFTTIEPFSYAKTLENVTYYSITWDLSEEITNNWTVKTETISYFIFWTWIAALTSIIITSWDNTMTISETISDNDVLIIDWDQKTVTIDWVDVDYTGTFIDLDVWANPILFDFAGWATFSCDITIIHKKKYK